MGDIKTALVTGADMGFGMFIVRNLAQQGWRVFATRIQKEYTLLEDLKKKYPEIHPVWADITKTDDIDRLKEEINRVSGSLDLLVSNAAHMGGDGYSEIGGDRPIDYEMMEFDFRTNSLAGIQLVDRLLPLMEKGEMKRLFFTSSEISSLKLMNRVGAMRYAMSKTALNLGVKMLFNELRPKGYTIRLYQPGGMKHMLPDGTYATGRSNVYPDVSAASAVKQMLEDRIDEDRLALIDYHGRELSF